MYEYAMIHVKSQVAVHVVRELLPCFRGAVLETHRRDTTIVDTSVLYRESVPYLYDRLVLGPAETFDYLLSRDHCRGHEQPLVRMTPQIALREVIYPCGLEGHPYSIRCASVTCTSSIEPVT